MTDSKNQITFTYGDKDYTLMFTRRTVREMERRGFVASEVTDTPLTGISTLFAGAFLAKHRNTKPELIEEIFSKLTDKDELIGKLAEMYNEPIITLLQEPEEDKGNVNWTAI